jgi:hypothetical protein
VDRQIQNLQRVSAKIGAAIIEFVRGNPTFHANDLRNYVASSVAGVAPASADRVLRDLRSRRLVDYVVLSRRDSLYHAYIVMQQAEIEVEDTLP